MLTNSFISHQGNVLERIVNNTRRVNDWMLIQSNLNCSVNCVQSNQVCLIQSKITQTLRNKYNNLAILTRWRTVAQEARTLKNTRSKSS